MSRAAGAEPRPAFHRRGATHGSASSTSSFSDDEDAITPCPPLQTTCNSQQRRFEHQDDEHGQRQDARQSQQQHAQSPPTRRRDSWRSSQVMHFEPHSEREADMDTQTLWRRMLAVQRVFGCYKSARMNAALDTGEEGFAPSRTCLDLLNDSIGQLPEALRRQLEEYLEHGGAVPSGQRRSWRECLVQMRTLH